MEADLDDRRLDSLFPVRATLPPGPAQLSFDFENFFLGQLRAAVQTVLHDPGYRSRAGIVAKEIGQYNPFDAIADIVDVAARL